MKESKYQRMLRTGKRCPECEEILDQFGICRTCKICGKRSCRRCFDKVRHACDRCIDRVVKEAIKPKEYTMNFKPLADRILIKRVEVKEVTEGGLHIPGNAQEKPNEGEVIAVGNGKRLDNGERQAPDVVAGDRILFGKYAGSEFKIEGEEHLILSEDEILGVIEEA